MRAWRFLVLQINFAEIGSFGKFSLFIQRFLSQIYWFLRSSLWFAILNDRRIGEKMSDSATSTTNTTTACVVGMQPVTTLDPKFASAGYVLLQPAMNGGPQIVAPIQHAVLQSGQHGLMQQQIGHAVLQQQIGMVAVTGQPQQTAVLIQSSSNNSQQPQGTPLQLRPPPTPLSFPPTPAAEMQVSSMPEPQLQ